MTMCGCTGGDDFPGRAYPNVLVRPDNSGIHRLQWAFESPEKKQPRENPNHSDAAFPAKVNSEEAPDLTKKYFGACQGASVHGLPVLSVCMSGFDGYIGATGT
jgi:hypothetical protein